MRPSVAHLSSRIEQFIKAHNAAAAADEGLTVVPMPTMQGMYDLALEANRSRQNGVPGEEAASTAAAGHIRSQSAAIAKAAAKPKPKPKRRVRRK